MRTVFTPQFVELKKAVPIRDTNDGVEIACLEFDQNLKDDLEFKLGRSVKLLPVNHLELTMYEEIFFHQGSLSRETLEILGNSSHAVSNHTLEENVSVRSAPVVKFVNEMIRYAIQENISDIHVEAMADKTRIRMRQSGRLFTYQLLPREIHPALITRIKIISSLDIAQKLLPQDGRMSYQYEESLVDLRVSIIPTVHGEKAVLRVLDHLGIEYTPEGIGLNGEDLKLVSKLMAQPQGLVLICGPTGSGKTSTLYTLLKMINHTSENILTIEDPVEFKLDGVNQIQVNPKIGLTFEEGLKSMLRQDPEIMMVGEIRNFETAEIALRSSITGHKVFSTLHTNDSPSSIVRLIDMGVEPYMISAGVIGIISQRLIRILCPKCKVSRKITDEAFHLHDEVIYEAVGCSECHHGYLSRQPIFEILIVDPTIRELIMDEIDVEALHERAVQGGMIGLKDKLIELMREGQTSLEEAYRTISTL